MKRVVITGATSMIGLSILKSFIDANIKVLAVVRRNSYKIRLIPKSNLVEILEMNLDDIKSYMPHVEADVFYHVAWESTKKNEGRFSPDNQIKNIQYTIDAVKLAHRFCCKKFIGVGSQAEYGPVDCDLTGKTVANPVTAYGIAKYAAGKMAEILCENMGMQFVWGRVLSVYGPHDNKDTLISYIIESSKQNDILKLTLCEQIWDYLYESDAGYAFYLLGVNRNRHKYYTIGSGEGRKLKDYVKIIEQVIGRDMLIDYGGKEYRDGEVMYLKADISALKSDTGFTPRVSFRDGIFEVVKECRKKG